MRVVSSTAVAQDADIIPLNERGGDGVLDTGGLVIVASTGIECEAANPPPTDPNLEDDVIKDTIPDKDRLLPNTGGMPLLALAVLGFALVAAGFSVFRLVIRRTT